MLYIVSTPIGNLEDITLRALKTLKEVDYIACEDTRHSGKLLQKYEIEKPLLSFHSHSGQSKINKIIDLLKDGKSIALISDAGTPGISDPAYSLIQAAIAAEIRIVPIPGASALLPALVASGIHMHNFLYLGFLPLKKGRQTLFQNLAESPYTIIIYESPHRILKTLKQILEFWGDRNIAIARELTKIHEEIRRSKTSEAIEHFSKQKPRGEFVIVIES